ncbi:hypothetical protein M409DRAFT_64161 [Zasmidium cellare ATCC 36951]|uniref:Carbohydrate-binding domain-containing protein n=1 Tax=Zasmidium cellare ATCC 36951 TaxID=1080233 RepID=A0A6A6CTI8_ZASCE|nr:uncharacterized protein M409DRAFT_64161 [Zasmidium cellare ATCC 36951]KAF2170411.1 hypothetical protein M409DRAFT_64161 [Zasmidium cellare ATCC 36951]
MRSITAFLAGLAIATPALAAVPSLEVPACPDKGTLTYNQSVPDKTNFPNTQVDLCYEDKSISITFTAYEETNFFYNDTYTTNDPIYEYEVMETFISRGTADPQTYLEFEIAPNNVTFQASIYNLSKTASDTAPFDTAYWTDPLTDGFTATTTLSKPNETWISVVKIPLGLFNVDDGQAKGTQWRMNFFRTVVAPSTFPEQVLGAWSPPDEAFHVTRFFGRVLFV